ncbi:MAG: hypothetical protein CL917_02095 [Deltaproteobacteria bacterium]|nr:hypothetical protein [Deltaproteobacteria bacterium]
MPVLPSDPISPSEFMEEFVPAAMAEAEIPKDVEVRFGVCLTGEGGGEWVMALDGGQASVEKASREEAFLTLIQTVDDWKGALWEGRGGVFGQQAAALFAGAGRQEGAEPTPAPQMGALSALSALDGLIRMRVTGGEGGDWSTDFKLGPGPIPEDATTEIEISAEDAQAMQEGTLDPMQAFMSGKIRVTGDMALMMQMQAALMAASQNS